MTVCAPELIVIEAKLLFSVSPGVLQNTHIYILPCTFMYFHSSCSLLIPKQSLHPIFLVPVLTLVFEHMFRIQHYFNCSLIIITWKTIILKWNLIVLLIQTSVRRLQWIMVLWIVASWSLLVMAGKSLSFISFGMALIVTINSLCKWISLRNA